MRNLHVFSVALLVAAALPLGGRTAHAAGEFELEPGFVSLFNGENLDGWTFRKKKTLEVLEAFDGKTETGDRRFGVESGRLLARPRAEEEPRGRLWTAKKFPDDFVLKLEFRASERADSGVYLRKPQLQVRDYLAAGPYRDLRSYRPQDWNEITVTVEGNVARASCNGEVLEEALELPADGPIGIESDRGTVEYRRIRVKALP